MICCEKILFIMGVEKEKAIHINHLHQSGHNILNEQSNNEEPANPSFRHIYLITQLVIL
jgi:hypothetical protein